MAFLICQLFFLAGVALYFGGKYYEEDVVALCPSAFTLGLLCNTDDNRRGSRSRERVLCNPLLGEGGSSF